VTNPKRFLISSLLLSLLLVAITLVGSQVYYRHCIHTLYSELVRSAFGSNAELRESAIAGNPIVVVDFTGLLRVKLPDMFSLDMIQPAMRPGDEADRKFVKSVVLDEWPTPDRHVLDDGVFLRGQYGTENDVCGRAQCSVYFVIGRSSAYVVLMKF
jgi:hypothetical protein